MLVVVLVLESGALYFIERGVLVAMGGESFLSELGYSDRHVYNLQLTTWCLSPQKKKPFHSTILYTFHKLILLFAKLSSSESLFWRLPKKKIS